ISEEFPDYNNDPGMLSVVRDPMVVHSPPSAHSQPPQVEPPLLHYSMPSSSLPLPLNPSPPSPQPFIGALGAAVP
ncbi:hypothetical protein PMAYCL1PPCAC_14602, partial [Pristionchus mayeri]